MVAATWVVPVLCLLPAVLEFWGKFGYVAMLVTCNLLLNHESQSFKLFLLIVRAVIPCGMIIFWYSYIYRVTRESHRHIARVVSNTRSFDLASHKQEMHLTRMMCVIFFVFIFSYMPCSITGIIDWNTVLSKNFHMYCALTIYLGSALNPIIYGLMNEQFRRAYLRIMRMNLKENQSSIKDTTCSHKRSLQQSPTLGSCIKLLKPPEIEAAEQESFTGSNKGEDLELLPPHLNRESRCTSMTSTSTAISTSTQQADS